MWEKEREELLQDYRYRKNILQEITLDDIEKWDNAGVGQKGDKGDTWKPSVDEEGNPYWKFIKDIDNAITDEDLEMIDDDFIF